MGAILIRSCNENLVDSGNFVSYLKSKRCNVKSPSRPFHEMEKHITCTIIDLRKEIMDLPPISLIDTGYDAGCADIAQIPLVLLVDENTRKCIPAEWFMCNHVFLATMDNVNNVVNLFIQSINTYQELFDIAEKADIAERIKLRRQIIREVDESINTYSKFINEMKGKL